jgi:hypothetical protein
MFVTCFNFFYSYFVNLHFFLFLCIYLFIFYFLFQKNYNFSNMFYNENNLKKLLYFFLIRCRFEVWKKKINLILFSSMVFFLFLLLSVLFFIFCHLFFNFLLRLFYCNKLLLPFVVLFFFRDVELGWIHDGTYGWKGQPPLDRCLEANVTSPNYTYRVKPPNIQPKEEDWRNKHQGYYILR